MLSGLQENGVYLMLIVFFYLVIEIKDETNQRKSR